MQSIDPAKLEAFVGKMVSEMGAAATSALVVIGDRLGLYRELAENGPLDSAALAERTDTAERYVREWLAANAASGYVTYDAESKRFHMTPEQVAVFADEESPFLMTGAFWSLASLMADESRISEAFRTGNGFSWGDHNDCLFCGTAKFFKPTYQAHLVSEWLPALEGVVPKLERGARVADVGCGHGISTALMAEAFPSSEFIGFDIHGPSIEHAREHAKDRGIENVRFEVATAKEFPGEGYDVVACFDCLHDMGDPAGAARHVREALAPDGTWMVVEPRAGDRLEENLNPVGRVYYAFSTTVCTPCSLSQEVGAALGAQAGERQLRRVIVDEGGFRRFRRAAETPFNFVLEARP